MRFVTAFFLALTLATTVITAGLSSPALAQSAADTEEPLVQESRASSMTGAQEARLADAIRDVREDFASNRRSSGFGNLLGGAIIGALGGYIAYTAFDEEPSNFGLGLFGLGIAGYGLNDIVSGIWSLAYPTPQERIAGKLLDNPTKLRSSGMLFLEQEAYRAQRARYVGGSLSIITGLSAGLLAIPLVDDDRADPILLGLLGLTAGIQVLDGLITLIGQSAAEERYEELQNVMEGSAHLHDLRLVPTLVTSRTDEGSAIGPGVAAGFRF